MKLHPFNLKRRLIAHKYRKGEFDQVIAGCKQILERNPNDVFTLELMARAYVSSRNWETGRLLLEQLFAIDADFSDVSFQMARCSIYTKHWANLNLIAQHDPTILHVDSITQALAKKLLSLSDREFIDFATNQEIEEILPESALSRWANIDFSQRPHQIMAIDRYCLDQAIGGTYLGHLLRLTMNRSISEARNTLDFLLEKYPISLVSTWLSPGLESNCSHSALISEWLTSYINPTEMTPQVLETLCRSEDVPPHIHLLVTEYLNNCDSQELVRAIRVIGKKSDPRNFFSEDILRKMIEKDIDVSDSDLKIHTWMVEHLLRTEMYDLLENLIKNQNRGIVIPLIDTLKNLASNHFENRLTELIRIIVNSKFLLTSQKIRHEVAHILLDLAEPEIAHAFAMECILLEPQDAVSGQIALQAAVKICDVQLLLKTADIVLSMRSRSNNIDYSAIAVAAIREKKYKFAEELLRTNRLRSNLLGHRTRIGLQFFEFRDYESTIKEIKNTPQAFRNDHTIVLYEFLSLLELNEFEKANDVLQQIQHPSEKHVASCFYHLAKGNEELAQSSIAMLNQDLGMRAFPQDWLEDNFRFQSLFQSPVEQLNSPNQELISVILTTHKWNDFLPTAVNSILSQTHTNFELIVVDDASPIEDIKRYDELMVDPRIVRIRSEENLGTYHSRNLGLEKALGQYVTFADSDDWVHPQKLEFSLSTMIENGVSIVINRFLRISEEGKIWFNGNKFSQFSLVGMFVSAKAIREHGLSFDGRARFGADSEFLERAEILLGKSQILRTNFIELLALHHSNSLTGGGAYSIDWTGPGPVRQRYTVSYRRNLELLRAGKADPNTMNYAPPQQQKSTSFVSPIHQKLRTIFGHNSIENVHSKNEENIQTPTSRINLFMATYPGGFSKVGDTVRSLMNQSVQFDSLIIHINAETTPKNIPKDNRIKIHNSTVNYADNGKFAHLDDVQGYVLTVDDDIHYPPDYLERMINAIEYYDRGALIGVHGAVIPSGPPITRWADYKDMRRSHVFSEPQSSYVPVNVIGTGTMGFHTDIGKPDVNSMNTLRMVDLHVAVWAQTNNIPMYIIPRKKNWMKEFENLEDSRIWEHANTNNELQHSMIATLAKVEFWKCDYPGACTLTNGPLSEHKHWKSRELPPLMTLAPLMKWPKMSDTPKVTIYIPAYNVEEYIEECVESALNQDYPNFEISIHDDGSTDNTWNILKSKYSQHPKIILNSLPNGGICFATNNAISNGTGELILQLDSDDFIAGHTLSTLVNAIKEGHVCAYGNFKRVNPDGSLIDEGWEIPNYSRERLMKDMIIHPPRLYRRDAWEFVGRHNESLVNAEDFDLFLRLSEIGTMIHVRESLYSYRILETSSTRSQSEIMTINTHSVIKSALVRQGIDKFEIVIPNPNFPRRVVFKHISFLEKVV